MENSTEDYKIQSFDLDTQMLLKTALKDPSSVNLDKVSNIIVDQSLKDQVFSKEAGRICYTIVQAEAKQNNGNVFRRNLLNRLQQEFKDREETRGRSLQEWVCYVTFICNIYDYLKVRAGDGEQHADGGSGPSCVRLSDEAGPTRRSHERRGGGLSGAAAASHRGAAGKGEQPADGRTVLPAAGRLPAPGGPLLYGPSAAAGDPGVQGWRLVAQQHRTQVLLQRDCGLEAGGAEQLAGCFSLITTDF